MSLNSERIRAVIVFLAGMSLFLYLSLTAEGITRVVALLWLPLLTYWLVMRFRALRRRENHGPSGV